MACSKQRTEAIGDLAGGNLSPEECRELLEHLEHCEPCSSELDLIADLLTATTPVSSGVNQTQAPQLTRRRNWGPGFIPRTWSSGSRIALSAAAIVLIGISLWLLAIREDEAPGPRLADLARFDPVPAASGVFRFDAPAGNQNPGSSADAAARLGNEHYVAAMGHYAAGRYTAAAERLSVFLGSEPQTPLALFYRAVCYLQDRRLVEAVRDLEFAASCLEQQGDEESLLRERTLWYLSNAHLASNRREASLSVLETLSQIDGDYGPNAAALANEIRKRLGAPK